MNDLSRVSSTHEHKDYEGAKLGMWIFLFTEILLFGGLFLLYGMYRAKFPGEFHEGGGHLNVFLGVLNTVVLLTSSFTMAMAITALQKGKKNLSVALIFTTVGFALLFMVDKYIEWSHEIANHIYPSSEWMHQNMSPGENIFFGLYYLMTGLHGIHVVIGIILLTVMGVLVYKGKITKNDYIALENSGLYWHLVDIIWIFLLPLFYLTT